MTRIVTTTYRYKPPPKRKGRKLAHRPGGRDREKEPPHGVRPKGGG